VPAARINLELTILIIIVARYGVQKNRGLQIAEKIMMQK
jgi:hypothetical protein